MSRLHPSDPSSALSSPLALFTESYRSTTHYWKILSLRADGLPIFLLGNVVGDMLMDIRHVIRAEERDGC